MDYELDEGRGARGEEESISTSLCNKIDRVHTSEYDRSSASLSERTKVSTCPRSCSGSSVALISVDRSSIEG